MTTMYRPRCHEHVVIATVPADGPDAPADAPRMLGLVVAIHIRGTHAVVLGDDGINRLVPFTDLAPWARPAA